MKTGKIPVYVDDKQFNIQSEKAEEAPKAARAKRIVGGHEQETNNRKQEG